MGTQLVNYNEEWAKQAEALAAVERPGGAQYFTVQGGILKLGDEEMPGNQVCAIIVDGIRVNTFYGEKYNADAPLPPVCYAIGRTEEEMAPHESMQQDTSYFRPQVDPAKYGTPAFTCGACPNNEWGSADQGRGKACQNKRQLALLPAGMYTAKRGSRDLDLTLFEDPAFFQTSDIAYLRIPVTSVQNWAKFVQLVAGQFRRPPAGVVARIFVEPDPKSQFKIGFEVIEPVPDDVATIVIQRSMQEQITPPQGFRPPSPEELQGGRNQPAGGFRRMRR